LRDGLTIQPLGKLGIGQRGDWLGDLGVGGFQVTFGLPGLRSEPDQV
jgi:hypothetical protein